MRPVDADVVDLVVAVAQLHNTVDDAAGVGLQSGLGGLGRLGSTDELAGALRVVLGDLTDALRAPAAPFWNAITFADAVLRLIAGFTMTWEAVIVVLLTLPSTRTSVPLVTALAAAFSFPARRRSMRSP